MSRYDVLGADDSVVVIKIKDAVNLAKSQGGVASLAAMFVPSTVGSEVYRKVASELSSALKAKNVNAEVSVLNAPPVGVPASKRMFVEGAAVGVGALGAGYGIFRLIKFLLRRK